MNKTKESYMRFSFKTFCCALLVALIAGCAAPSVKKGPAVFFPVTPELPRLQYLVSYTGLKDIEEESAFDKFVAGEKPNLRLDKPYGVGIYDGKIYVCDSNAGVFVFDLKAKKYGPLEGSKGPGKLMQPLNIGIEEDGTKYVADPVRGQVVVFDRDDKYLRTYGTPGNWKPVDAQPFGEMLYVVDEKNGVVKVFDKKTGEVVRVIGNRDDIKERLGMPTNAAFDSDGNLYVADAARFQVMKFDRDGHFISSFGRAGDSPSSFARPRGVAVDRKGNLYAVDAAYNNVQIFNKDGRLLMFFGARDTARDPGALVLPARVVIDYDNLKYFEKYVDPSFDAEHLVIVTSQFGQRLVNVYASGKQKGVKYPTDEEIKKLLEEKRKKEIEELKKKEKQEGETAKKEPEDPGSVKAADEESQPGKLP